MESLKYDSIQSVADTLAKSTKQDKTHQIIAIDVETTMRCERDGMSSATPWDPANQIAYAGFSLGPDRADDLPREAVWCDFNERESEILKMIERDLQEHNSRPIFAGHNFKFDLHYIAKTWPELHAYIVANPIWDTSIAEYVLTGQQAKFASLAELAMKYCPELSPKGDIIKRIIEEGGDMLDVKYRSDIITYMRHDVRLTHVIAKRQMALAEKENMLRIIFTMCAAMKAIQEMEWNGIEFDLRRCATLMLLLEDDITNNEAAIVSEVTGKYEVLSHDPDKWLNSNVFWSSYFFGGEYKFEYKEPNGEWKSGPRKGTTKFKKVTEVIEFPRLVDPTLVGSSKGKSGHYSVDDGVLHKMHGPLVTTIKSLRATNKLLNTYMRPLPTKMFGKYIHTNLHQTSTDTGRLSSSNPNLQNVAGGETGLVKQCFVPGEGNYFIEADYKQLEVIALAYVTQDQQLLDDIRNGIDIHNVIAEFVFGPTYTKEQRRIVKTVNFGTIYGGGVQTIASQSHLDEKLVWEIRNRFFTRYPNIKVVRNAMLDDLSRKFSILPQFIDSDTSKPFCSLTSPTGRWYTIPMTKKIGERGVEWQGHYTKTCNYPIQGLATGDIVPMMLAHIWKWRNMQCEFNLKLCNTVHDSILFTYTPDRGDEADVVRMCRRLKEELESAPEVFNRVFNPSRPFDLPLKVDIQYTNQSWQLGWKTLND